MKSPKEKYEARIEYYRCALEKQNKVVNWISNLRLFEAASALLSFFIFHRWGYHMTAWGTMAAFLLLFIYLVVIHDKAIKIKEYISALYNINNMSKMRLEGQWKDFEDRGDDFKDDRHPYSQDLDIFGNASLFQWINTSYTGTGREALAKALIQPCSDIKEIKLRQGAVDELSKMRWWRQRLAVEGLLAGVRYHDDGELLKWSLENNSIYRNPWVIMGLRIMPVITISSLVLSFGFHLIPNSIFIMLALIQFGMLALGADKRNRALGTAYNYKNQIKLYAKILEHIEKPRFNSPYLVKLQKELLNSDGQRASKQIKKLERIVESISNRNNAMFLPINILLLWDYQGMIALESWREKLGRLVKSWIDIIGEIESLSSLAQIRHDHPDWAMPHFTEEHSVFRAKSIGHPLLSGKRVCNDVALEKPTRALLITGSNMSGKSTLLRTAGINLVLAYAGAPVCAKYMMCSIMSIHTCMRVSDNLGKNISSFYAELLRIRAIVNASRGEKQVFFLLDEIFKGTNSQDRHIGAKTVIKKLCESNALGMVSTHDLELGNLEVESRGQVKNYHFQEYYKNDRIHFDYKLRPGISTTRNAMYLMRMVGINGSEAED